MDLRRVTDFPSTPQERAHPLCVPASSVFRPKKKGRAMYMFEEILGRTAAPAVSCGPPKNTLSLQKNTLNRNALSFRTKSFSAIAPDLCALGVTFSRRSFRDYAHKKQLIAAH